MRKIFLKKPDKRKNSTTLLLILKYFYDIINEKMGIIKPHQIFVTSETKGTILARLQEECDVLRNKENESIDEIFRRMFKC